MPRLNHILFPVDFSGPSVRIVRDVKAIAEHFHAKLTLLHVAGAPGLPVYPASAYSAARKQILEKSTRLMDSFVARHFRSFDLDVAIEQGDPAEVIVDYARRRTDLIMLATHGHGPFRRFLTGSVTAKVLHDAVCPVWTAAHTDRAQPHPSGLRTIVCGVDCNSDAVALIRWAGWIAGSYGATVKLVHVIPALNETSRNRGEVSLRRYFTERAQAEFDVIMDHTGFRNKLLLRGGSIPARLAETVRQEHADLLIVGRGRLRKALGRLRTHSLAIVRESPRPVISV